MEAGSRKSSKCVDPAGSTDWAPLSVSFPQDGVYRRLLGEGHQFQFSQVVRLLELAYPEAPDLGKTARFGDVPIHIRPSSALVFPPSDVKEVRVDSNDERVHVLATFLGLYGIDSPLPYHFYESLAHDFRDTAPHRQFLDIFNHRFYAFFYRAWKKYRPGLYFQVDGQDRHSQRFVSLAGLGMPGTFEKVFPSPIRLAAQASVLGQRSRNAEGLKALLQSFFEDIPIEVVENVPRWVPVPSRGELGDGTMQLGQAATIGKEVYDRAGKFQLRLGPMEVEQYLSLLPGGEDANLLHRLIRIYVPNHLEYEVELKIPSDDLPTAALGETGAQLGYTACLGGATESTMSRIVEYD